MHRLFQFCLVAAMAVVLTVPAIADDEAKAKKKKGQQARRGVGAQLMAKLKDAGLSDDQEAKIKEIVKAHSEKLMAANKKMAELVGADGRKKMQAAMKKAREDGKKGKELQAAALEALGLTGDKVGAYKEAQAAMGKIRGELNKAVVAVLTPEQREKAKLRVGRAGGKKAGAKKPGAKKAGAKKGAKKKDADK